MERLLWIAAGGAAGSVARYAVGSWMTRALPLDFAWGTFTVNVVGSLLLGFVMQLAVEARVLSDTARLALGVGVLGGFTTYSTFAYETWRLAEAHAWGRAVFYAAATAVACVAAVAAVTLAGRAVTG